MNGSRQRPLGITLLAAFETIVGLWRLIGGLLASTVGLLAICFAPGIFFGGPKAIVIGILQLVLAFALWGGWAWARLLIVVVSAFSILIAIFGGGGVQGGEIGSILLSLFAIWYMSRPNVVQYFSRRS
jgi:hypothetical protein